VQIAKIKMTMIEYINLCFLILQVFFYLKVAYIIEAGVFGITVLKLTQQQFAKTLKQAKMLFCTY